MIIESKRLILRTWKDEDIDCLFDGLNNINVSKWLAGVPYPYTKDDAKNFIEYTKQLSGSSKNMMLAIVLKENGIVIGGTSIENIQEKDGTAEGGIWLNEKYQNNGYGIEAFSARAKYCFDILKLRRLENGYFIDNEKSKNMQHRLGYKDEGLRRKKYLCLATNQYTDECITGLLKEEFIAFNP
ncbi:putative succinyl-CoA transferase [Clostridiales bacterium]|nr:putative succinyl-CoA transferase [Clostridiales bacterium]